MEPGQLIKNKLTKILVERDEIEDRVVSAIILVYDEKIQELYKECEEKTGHKTYPINFGFQDKCLFCGMTVHKK